MTKEEYEKELESCYRSIADDLEISIPEVKEYLKKEWGEYGEKGYGIFSSGSEPNAFHICKIDEMGIFDSDLEAAIWAQKNGDVKLIPMKEVTHNHYFEYWRYIDTPDNRKALKDEGGLYV